MSFDEWMSKNLAKGEQKTWIEWCGEAYKAGAASRQAEVDELQKRINNSLKVFEESNLSSLEQIEKVYGILKGEQNDCV